jgi:hypothetical protein
VVAVPASVFTTHTHRGQASPHGIEVSTGDGDMIDGQFRCSQKPGEQEQCQGAGHKPILLPRPAGMQSGAAAWSAGIIFHDGPCDLFKWQDRIHGANVELF